MHFGMISVGGEGQCVAARLGDGAMLTIGRLVGAVDVVCAGDEGLERS
jgi:hypothetical protein